MVILSINLSFIKYLELIHKSNNTNLPFSTFEN